MLKESVQEEPLLHDEDYFNCFDNKLTLNEQVERIRKAMDSPQTIKLSKVKINISHQGINHKEFHEKLNDLSLKELTNVSRSLSKRINLAEEKISKLEEKIKNVFSITDLKKVNMRRFKSYNENEHLKRILKDLRILTRTMISLRKSEYN